MLHTTLLGLNHNKAYMEHLKTLFIRLLIPRTSAVQSTRKHNRNTPQPLKQRYSHEYLRLSFNDLKC